MAKRLFLAPLGCAKNQIDGELMLGYARAAGYELADQPDDADVLVVNTCAFIEEAREESIGKILEMAEVKARAEGRRLVVTGCLAERYGEQLASEIPEVDAFVGTGALDRVVDAAESRGGAIFKAAKHYLPSALMERVVSGNDGSAYLKVSEGCDHECSFCVIPDIRGKHQSRTIDDIVTEAERLVERGVLEVNLVAQDLSAYGKDQMLDQGLAALLYRLGRVDGLARIRCHYLYPNTLSDAALDAINDVDTVCPYIDLPLQHADAAVLVAMRRARGPQQLLRLIERIRARVEDPVLRTTLIVGFPGETDAAFENLRRFVEEVGFDHISVFKYSREEGSAAATLDHQVPEHVAEHRRDVLLSIQERISAARLQRFVGRVEPLLLCGYDSDAGCYGRTRGQAPEIDGLTFLGTDVEAGPGSLIDVRITGCDAYDLYARPLGQTQS